jgi:hypothetical protein
MERKQAHVGDVVIFVDAVGRDQNALVTAAWGSDCLNLVMVSLDEKALDNYGRQTERSTSVLHVSIQPAHGMYWRWPGEEKNPIQEPTER